MIRNLFNKKILCVGLFILCLTNTNAQTENDTVANKNSVDTIIPEKSKGASCGVTVETVYVKTKFVTDLTKAMLGEFAGVRVITENGQPGIASDIRIRGVNSINASSKPVYVVDRIIYNGDITALNIEDIAWLNVNKNINNWLFYGTQVSNGVIQISTKRGTAGYRPRVEVDVRFGFNFAPQRHEIITDPKTYTELGWLGLYTAKFANVQNKEIAVNFANNNLFSNMGINPYYNPFDRAGNNLINPVTGKMFDDVGYRYKPEKWSDYLLHTGKKVETNASISGGNEKFVYYTSFGFIKDEGYYLKSDFQRINALANFEYTPKRWLDIYLNIAYNNSVLNDPCQVNNNSNGFYFLNGIAPIFPVFIPNTKDYDFGEDHNRNFVYGMNPLALLENDKSKTSTNNLLLNNSIKIKLPFKLSIISEIGYNYFNANLNEIWNPFYGDAAGIGRRKLTNNIYHHLTARQMLRYDETFIGKHEIVIFAGHEIVLEQFTTNSMTKSFLFDPYNSDFDNYSVTDNVSGYTNKFKRERVFAGAYYNYAEKYFVNANMSYDKSPFLPKNRWYGSWSVGGAWLVSNEKFMRSSKKWLNYFKIYASYGVIGNDNFNFIVFDGTDIRPEKNSIFNAGIEINIKRVFDIEIDFYDRTISNMVIPIALHPSLGLSNVPVNDALMINRGVDFLLSAKLIHTRNIDLKVRANANYHFSKMVNLSKEMRWGKWQEVISPLKGHALDMWYLPEYAGVDKQTGEPLWYAYYDENDKYDAYGRINYIQDVFYYLNQDDANGELKHPNAKLTKTITNDCRNAASNFTGKKASPDVFGGFGFDFNCYGFDLSATFAYQIGGWGYDNIYATLMQDVQFGNYAWHKDMQNAWNPLTENYNTDVPRLTNGFFNTGNWGSTRFLTSNSALQLANLTLGYNFPQKYIKVIFLNQLNIYVSCNNLLLASARKGYNPFTFYDQNSRSQYLQGTTLQMGVKVVF